MRLIRLRKTTLANSLSNFGFQIIHEDFKNNPFLEKVYSEPNSANIENNVSWFLDKQHSQIKTLGNSDTIHICDYSILTTCSYACSAGVMEQKRLNDKLSDIISEVGYPEILLVMKIPVEQQMERIKARSREGEEAVAIEYLEMLNSDIENRLKLLPSNVKVLEIDALKDFNKPHEAQYIAKKLNLALNRQSGFSIEGL